MNYETLRYDQDDHVVVLTYDRPEQRNAISRRMNEELHHAWRRRDSHAIGAGAFKERRVPEWPHHGL